MSLIGGVALFHTGIQTQAEGCSSTFDPWLPRSLWGLRLNQFRREKSMEEKACEKFFGLASISKRTFI